jgi:hypothetical protein
MMASGSCVARSLTACCPRLPSSEAWPRLHAWCLPKSFPTTRGASPTQTASSSMVPHLTRFVMGWPSNVEMGVVGSLSFAHRRAPGGAGGHPCGTFPSPRGVELLVVFLDVLGTALVPGPTKAAWNRCSRKGPRSAKWPQDGPRTAQDSPTQPLDCPQTAQDTPTRSKTKPRGPTRKPKPPKPQTWPWKPKM